MRTIQFVNSIEVCKSAKGHLCIFMHYQHGKKQHRDKVEVVAAGPSLKRRQNEAVSRATDALKTIRAQISLARLNGTTWTHPRDAARSAADQAAKQQADEHAERNALLYETVVSDFLRDEAFDDAKPKEARRSLLNRASWAFGGKSWADITRQDAERYPLDRVNGTGWFKEWPNKVKARTPESELGYLRRLGFYLCRCGLMQSNPFAAPPAEHKRRSKKKARRSALTYVPERKPVLPVGDAVRLAFRLLDTGWTKGNGKTVKPDPQLAALLALSAYTGSRPESEPCKLRRADVELPAENVRSLDGKPVLGSVTYRETKCGNPVTVPLHPHAAALVGTWLDQRPEAPETFLFVKRGSSEPWDCNSYRKRWERLRAEVARHTRAEAEATAEQAATPEEAEQLRKAADETHAELMRWCLRDLRKLFKTRLRQANFNNEAVKVLQGHALTVDERYNVPTEEYKARAILTLNWQPSRVRSRQVAEGRK